MTPSHLAVRQVVDQMNLALRERYVELKTLLAEATGKDVRARHRIGRLIADVKASEQRYGARAVKNLAAALGRDEATLYRFALVAEAWNERELEALLARRTPHGEPLSFSHLVELAQMASKADRVEMLEFALSYGVSVRELIEAIADTGKEEGSRPTDAVPSIDALLRRVASACDAVHRKIEVSERLLSQLDRSDPKSRLTLDKLLSRAVSSQRAILEASARSIERLERARERLSHPAHPALPDPASSSARLSSPASPPANLQADEWTETAAAKSMSPAVRRTTKRSLSAAPASVRTPRLLAGLAR